MLLDISIDLDTFAEGELSLLRIPELFDNGRKIDVT